MGVKNIAEMLAGAILAYVVLEWLAGKAQAAEVPPDMVWDNGVLVPIDQVFQVSGQSESAWTRIQ